MTTPHLQLRGAALLALVTAGSWACGRQKVAVDASSSTDAVVEPTTPQSAAPWLGPYSIEQQNLLAAPVEAPIEQRAPYVYPDLARFTFIGEGQIKVPYDLLGYADAVTRTLDNSPLTYVFRTGPETIANVRALWGPDPADEPDPWKRVETLGGQPSLVDALPSTDMNATLRLAMSGTRTDTLDLLKELAATPGAPPGVQVMLADAAIVAGDLATAEKASRAALEIDPRFPHAHRALAEVYLQQGDRDRARQELARALASFPRYARAWRVSEVLMNGPIHRPVDVPAPFIEVTRDGAVLVVSCERPLCQGYAACKAAFRYEPMFRGSMLRESYDTPYHLSATEEVVCLEAGLGAHLSAQEQEETKAPPDPTAELLLRLASEMGLSSYAMFEILGQHRPEWLRIAPEASYQATVRYVLNHILRPQSLQPLPGVVGGAPVTAGTSPARSGSGS